MNKIFEKIQEKMLLKHTGYLDPGESHYFLGRQIHNEGNYFDIKLDDGYIETILQEVNMTKCNPAPTPGTAANKSTFADSEPLTPDQHKVYRRVVGKLQWLSFTRPDISYSTKELARGLPQPTEADWKKGKHLLRYLRGRSNFTQQLGPTTTEHKQSSPRYGCTRGRRLGRMLIYTQEHKRVHNLHSRNTSEFRFQNTSYTSLKLGRK